MEPGTGNLITRLTTLAVAALTWPAVVSAQTSRGISLTPPDLPQWEVSGEAGWLSSNKSEIGQDWNDGSMSRPVAGPSGTTSLGISRRTCGLRFPAKDRSTRRNGSAFQASHFQSSACVSITSGRPRSAAA